MTGVSVRETLERARAIQERENAATPGPWEVMEAALDGREWLQVAPPVSKNGPHRTAAMTLVGALAAELAAALAREAELREALADLHAEVEMAESVGICLPDRVPSLRAGQLLASAGEPAAEALSEQGRGSDGTESRVAPGQRQHGTAVPPSTPCSESPSPAVPADTRHAEAIRTRAKLLIRDVTSLDNALAECDSKAEQVADHPDGPEWVSSYNLRCGPWHRVLGRRSSVAYSLAQLKEALGLAAAGSVGAPDETKEDE